MPTYAGSRLSATGKVTGGERRAARRALDKRIRTALNEKLLMEVEMSIPQDVTDIRADRERVAEAVVKLICNLKQGPLMEAETDEQQLDGAIKFLVTSLGKEWMRSWFQLHTVENGSTSTVSTAIAENTKTKAQSIVQKLAQHERQGDLNNTSSTQNLDVKFGLMPILPTSVQEGSDTMPRGATALGSQLLKLPTGTVLCPPVSRDSSASIESLQPVLETTLMQVSALEVATYSLSASESVRVPTQLGPVSLDVEPQPTPDYISLITGDCGKYASPAGSEEQGWDDMDGEACLDLSEC